MPLETFQNEFIRISVSPEFGGRVTELTDLSTGRDWLIKGEHVGSPDADAIFGLEQAVGWDECFPSGAACTVSGWATPLRDHGEFWGRSAKVARETDTLVTRFGDERCEFTRTMTLRDRRLQIQYHVINRSEQTLPYLWGQHLLLNVEDTDRLEFDGIKEFNPAFLTHKGSVLEPEKVEFPADPHQALPDLSMVHPISENFATKLFTKLPVKFAARVIGENGQIAMNWDIDEVPYMGLWLDYGGWPDDKPTRQISIAPTTAPFESLETAIGANKERSLGPGQTDEWTVEIILS